MTDLATCVICGDPQTAEASMIRAPCGQHHVCSEDLEQYFLQATKDESQYPPSCCGTPYLLADYDDYLPFEVTWEYQFKQRGEYAVQRKFRVYCADPSCAAFLRPDTYNTEPDFGVTYAKCEKKACGKVSCISCKTILTKVPGHICSVAEADKQFRAMAEREGYQECYACGSTVELTEACNHISCECGNDFCYICGKPWPGVHGCPHYGRATFDEEGFNQDGFHRDTELNREDLTRRQQQRQDDPDLDDDELDEDDDFDEDDMEVFPLPPWATQDFIDFLSELPLDLGEEAIDQEETRRIELELFHIPDGFLGELEGLIGEDQDGGEHDEDEDVGMEDND